MNNLRIVFDKVDNLLSLSDSLGQDECRVVITYPDSIEHDLGKVLKASNDWAVSIPSRTDSDGNYMEGLYSFLFERYDVGGTTPTATDSGEFTLDIDAKIPAITETLDPFTPSLLLTDSTDWDTIDNVWTVATLLRTWNATSGAHVFGPSLQPSIQLYDSGYHTGDYTYTFDTTTKYDHDNGWVSARLYLSVAGAFTINKPLMLPEIAALFNCLFTKILAKNCCKDATYDEMVSDYNMAMSMSQNFILNGQSGITGAIQSSLLFGSDCNPGILGLLRKHGCEDTTVEDTLLSAYDWCLCESDGGGGGVVASREGYESGTGCFITSDATDDDDRFTSAVASGVLTFTQNRAGSRIFGGTVRGDSGSATHTSNGATNSFKVVLPIPGENCNLGYATALLGDVNVWSAPASNPTAASPWVKDEGSVQKRLVDISSGTISFVLAGIGATYPSGWAITFETP